MWYFPGKLPGKPGKFPGKNSPKIVFPGKLFEVSFINAEKGRNISGYFEKSNPTLLARHLVRPVLHSFVVLVTRNNDFAKLTGNSDVVFAEELIFR